MPPPLPAPLIQTILSHLLPPRPPLPTHLLAQPLLRRLTFLPPDPNDLGSDEWFTPSPSPRSSGSISISDQLEELARDRQLGEVQYGFDGETIFARLLIRRSRNQEGEGEEDGQGLDVLFAWEDAKGDTTEPRGWVYHATQPTHTSTLQWTNDIDDILGPSQAVDGETTQAPEEYWGGFTPPSSTRPLDEPGPQGEDDYWASYGLPSETPAGPTPHQTPGIPDEGKMSQQIFDVPVEVGEKVDDLRDKVTARISGMLRALWAGWRGEVQAEDMMEEKAIGWLRLGREVMDGQRRGGDENEMVIRAQIEVLKELFAVVSEDGDEAFWRLVEGAIRMPVGQVQEKDQVGYWE